jgi:hypothetical protein
VLLANGSDITATDKDGRSPLHKACERGCLAVGVVLLENKADVGALDLVRAIATAQLRPVPQRLMRARPARWTARRCTPRPSAARLTLCACSRCTVPG